MPLQIVSSSLKIRISIGFKKEGNSVCVTILTSNKERCCAIANCLELFED